MDRLLQQLRTVPQLLRKHLSLVMIAVGAILLGYVCVEYGQMYWSQRQLRLQWEAQQRQLERSEQPGTPVADDGLTRIHIPRIDLTAIVVEGTSHKALLVGPGHIKDTPAPGEPGNSVISAHRDTFFRHIYELQKGDEVLVQRKGKIYRYQVTGKKIVQPDDVSVLDPTSDSRLTLITCYPTYYIGPAPERLVVTSKLMPEQVKEASAGSVKPASATAH